MTNSMNRCSQTILKRSLALLVAFTTLLGLMPGVDFSMMAKADEDVFDTSEEESVYADSDDRVVYLGTKELGKNTNTQDAATVYYGGQTWRVIGYNRNGVASSSGDATLLAADTIGEDTKFIDTDSNIYADSILKTRIEGVANGFSEAEKSAIKKRTLTVDEYTNGVVCDGVSTTQVDDAQLWPLSTKEAKQTDSTIRKASKHWWLRSPGSTNDSAASVDKSNYVRDALYVKSPQVSIRPAFNLDLSSVLMTSKASLSASQYKVTLKDDDIKVESDGFTQNGSTITVPYTLSGSDSGNVNRISVLITDKNYKTTSEVNVLSNGPLSIEGTIGTSGTGTYTLPDSIPENCHMYLIAEITNADNVTDLASIPTEITILNYNLWIGETLVDYLNCNDILGDGKVSYDSETKTLYFDDFTYKKGEGIELGHHSNQDGLIYKGGPAGDTLVIDGKVDIDIKDDDENTTGIQYDNGTVIMKGDIKLRVKKLGIYANNVVTEGNLIIETTKGNTSDKGIWAKNSINVSSGCLNVSTNNSAKALFAQGKKITVSESMNDRVPAGIKAGTSKINDAGYYLVIEEGTAYLGSIKISEPSNSHTVFFSLNGKPGLNPSSQRIATGQKVTRPSSDPKSAGYIFKGWYTDKECITEYDFSSSVNSSFTLYADWELSRHNVSFSMNGKTASDVPDAQNVEHGKNAFKPAQNPKAEGFVFTGWFSDKNCTSAYDFSTPVTDDITIYAGWSEIPKYSVTFDMNEKTDATDVPESQTVESGKKSAKPAKDPKCTGFTFAGWYKEKECTTPFDFDTLITSDTKVFAKWIDESKETFSVTFDLNKKPGTAPDKQTVEKGGKASKPADPNVEGFTFTGWFTDSACTNAYDFSSEVNTDITLYAGWKETTAGDDPVDPSNPEKKDPRKTPVTPAPVIKESTINDKIVKIEADITYPQAVTWTGSTITKEQLAVLDEKDGAIAKVDITGLFEAIPALKSGIVPSKLVKVSYTVVGKTITDSSTKAYFTVSVKLDKKAVKRAKIKGNDKKALQALVKDLNDQIKDVKYYFEIVPIQLEDASSVTVKAAFDKKKYVKTNEDNTLKKVKSVKITVKIPSGKNGKTKNKSYTYKKAKDLNLFRITVTDMANKKKATADISATDTNTRFNGTKTGITVKP